MTIRNLALGLLGAALIALPAGLASAQGQKCDAGSKNGACVTTPDTQGKSQQTQSKTSSGKSSATQADSPMKTGESFSGGEKISNAKSHGLSEQSGSSYYKKDGKVYRVDDSTGKILAVVGAVAELLK